MVLPNKEYIPGIKHDRIAPEPPVPPRLAGVVGHVGLPCVLKDAYGGGWSEVYVCHSLDELLHHYDHSGLLTMIVQEFIEWEEFVRCMCIGREQILPDPVRSPRTQVLSEPEFLPPPVMKRVIADSRKLVRALGYDMNSIEWAIRDGIPYAIDFMNPAPDMDINSLTPVHFEWAVGAMADVAIRLAKAPADRGAPSWSGFLKGRPLSTRSRKPSTGSLSG